MSPICQSFVQNAWRKDLCSNCFKSEEEHGTMRSNSFGNGLKDCGGSDLSNSNARRYVGVAGRSGRPGLYSRNYYGSNSWNPLMLDNSNNESRILKSPGLIKGMNSIIKQENEKNRNFTEINSNSNEGGVRIQRRNTDIVNGTNIPKDSWILSQIIGEPKTIKGIERSERVQGDSSSDLGSDASHDSSSNSGNTYGSSEGDLKAESDTSSLKSEQDSAHEDEHIVHGILKTSQSLNLHRSLKNSISFKEDCEVIGYGGDVDYSDDDEDDYEDDDDDDRSSISSSELNSEELSIKRLTEKNTNFNSENENLEKDPPLHKLEEIMASTLSDYSKTKNEISEEFRQDVKVKLKRSQPVIGSKPPLKALSSVTSNVPSHLLSSQTDSSRENIPMQGIKPKFVSRDEEMKESALFDEIYRSNKVTSLDEVCSRITSIDDLSHKTTCVDDLAPKITSVDNISPKITSVDEITHKITNLNDLPYKTTSVTDDSKITSIDDVCRVITSSNDKTSPGNELLTKPTTTDTSSSVTNNNSSKADKTAFSIVSSDNVNNDDELTKPEVVQITKNKGEGTNENVKNSSKLEKTSITQSLKSPIEHKTSKVSSLKQPVSCGLSNKRESDTTLDFINKGQNLLSKDLESSETNKESTIDYSVTSAQLRTYRSRTSSNDKEFKDSPSSKDCNSRDILEKVSSGVVPMNLIQRRSSFMESQLGGVEFSMDSNFSSSHLGGVCEVKSAPKKGVARTRKESFTSEDGDLVVSGCEKGSKGNVNTENKVVQSKNVEDDLKAKDSTKKSSDTETAKVVNKVHENPLPVEVQSSVANKKAGLNFQISTYENSKRTREEKVQSEKSFESNQKFLETEKVLIPPKEKALPTGSKVDDPSQTEKSSENLETNTQEGKSNTFSTFGTPVSASKGPNSSFLHSGAVGPVTDSSEINSVIYSTPEFLKDIKSHTNNHPVTASIQKSALYAPSSNLKGVSLGKPATTPKPNYLRDKPKIPIKPFVSSSSIYNREIVTPKQNHGTIEGSSGNLTSPDTQPNLETGPKNSYENLNRKNSCGTQNSATPCSNEEVVYDVPVTVTSTNTTTSFSAPSPSSSSSGYSTTSNLSQTGDNVKDEQRVEPSNANGCSSPNHLEDLVRAIELNDSYKKAKFEATKIILSESLSFEHKPIPRDYAPEIPEVDKIIDSEEKAKETKVSTDKPKIEVTQEDDDEQEETACDDGNDNVDRLSVNSADPDTYKSGIESTHSYVNINPPFESHDADSYSSFTDDFDDEDEDIQQNKRQYENIDSQGVNTAPPPLRRTERSSSATPIFRNSVGPINFCPINSAEVLYPESHSGLTETTKQQAVRSQSVPRSVDNAIDPSIFGKSRPESSSRFGFVKSGFFRPSSPPSTKRKTSSERGRDRTKKSHSGFSLKKLLRFGSGEKSFRAKDSSSKEQEKMFQRETRKLRLQIIHPLDYNTNGVEVISRPEKRSPTYDFTGINDPYIQEALRQQQALANINYQKAIKSEEVSRGTAPGGVESSVNADDSSTKMKNNGEKKVEKKNSFLRKKRKTERIEQDRNEPSMKSYVRSSEPTRSNLSSTENLNDINNQKNAGAHNTTSVPGAVQANTNLGYNSEGRPRPPPPPRKTSLDTNAQDALRNMMNPPTCPSDTNYSGVVASTGSRYEADTSSMSSTCSSTRPSRPPPPRRTPSNTTGLKAKDSLYANLGNARASFTPRKPGRTCSIKDDEREKRKAPNPPQPIQYQKLRNQVSNTHKDDHSHGAPSVPDPTRSVKGPAPPAPPPNHDYEYIPGSTPKTSPPDDGFNTPPNTYTFHNIVSEHETPEGYILPAYIQYSSYFKEEKLKQEAVRSSSSLNPEKTTRQRGRRSSIVTNLSLEDQYGAVVFANLEALSNLLDQMCSRFECGGYERVVQQVTSFSSITLLSRDPISCGMRLFYPASASDCKITLMVTPEAKVEADPLLMPSPILMLKDDIPDSFLPNRRAADHTINSGSVWVLPDMNLCSLEEFSHTSQSLLQQERAPDWERRVCLFLLQVVSALKQLQAKGIEETSLDLMLVILNLHNDDNPRLLLVSADGNSIQSPGQNPLSLCHCAAGITQLLLGHTRPLEAAMEGPVLCPPFTPSPHAFVSLITTLREERSSSLTKAKCILETVLFGPEDVKVRSGLDSETAIQKWLDLERANVLHSLVREQANGSFNKKCILTKFQLLFLVRTNAKALKEAITALQGPDVTNF